MNTILGMFIILIANGSIWRVIPSHLSCYREEGWKQRGWLIPLHNWRPASSISWEVSWNLPPGALQFWPAVAPVWFWFYVANVSIWNSRHFPFLLLTEMTTKSMKSAIHSVLLLTTGSGKIIQKQPKNTQVFVAFKCIHWFGAVYWLFWEKTRI